MSFFKDFKDDLSLAVNELLPGEDMENDDDLDEESDMMVNTLEGELDIESELSKLDGLLEQVHDAEEAEDVQIEPKEPKLGELPDVEASSEEMKPKATEKMEMPSRHTNAESERKDGLQFSFDVQSEDAGLDLESADEPVIRSIHPNHKSTKPSITIKEEIPMNEEMTKDVPVMEGEMPSAPETEITDEVSIITEGTVIKGNLSTTGSFSISGRVEGNVQCNGKLEVTGTIKGNSSSSEIFSDAAKIEGEITSTGTVKIGLGSVVVGNITATSAVVAGAVKGDIDVQGPVVVDTSAVIVGNIKSRSVQINNGAVIEGFCSQCYAEIDVDSLFGEAKKGK